MKGLMRKLDKINNPFKISIKVQMVIQQWILMHYKGGINNMPN